MILTLRKYENDRYYVHIIPNKRWLAVIYWINFKGNGFKDLLSLVDKY